MSSEATFSFIELRAFVHYCVLRGMKTAEIIEEMSGVLEEQCPSPAFITTWARRFRAGETRLEDAERSGRPVGPDHSETISMALTENPFISAMGISVGYGIPYTTVHRVLTQQLGLKYYVSRWIPAHLDQNQKANRVRDSKALLGCIEDRSYKGFTNLLTADESWFYHSTEHPGRWARTPEEVEPRVSKKINAKKTLVVVFWGITGARLIHALPTGVAMNSDYLCNVVFPELDKSCKDQGRTTGVKGLRLHWDNARPHTAAATVSMLSELKITTLPHPAYSPDLAPSDYYLFGKIKHQLLGCTFPDSESLVSAITRIFSEIDKDELVSVFMSWKERVARAIELEGEYL